MYMIVQCMDVGLATQALTHHRMQTIKFKYVYLSFAHLK